ncbi:MAG: segregation and condensation protein A [Gammaproteobacteria bacterium]
MSDETLSKEAQVLRMVKRVLTDIAKDTSTAPGLKHPLSDTTIQGIRDCLSLISARELELAEEAGQPMTMRPRFTDEPKASVVVPIDKIGRRKGNNDNSD